MPVPSIVFVSDIMGLPVEFQQTPRVVMVAPPSEVIFPPQVIVVEPINDTDRFVKLDKVALVVEYN